MDLFLFNTLTKKKELFVPINPPTVALYTCGMTVYDYAHVGHGRKYVMDDILKRTLNYNGFKVKHVQNVTDVGHLVSDEDEGEDKLEKGAKKQGKTVWEVADYFTKHFYDSMDKLNVLKPDIICKATDHIKEQIEVIVKLFENGYAYDTPEAVYFDTTKFLKYGELTGQKQEDKKIAVREEIKTGEHKKNPHDFALWFKRVGRFVDHNMHWDSPWGDGFPGWHIECSAMSMKYLGDQIDIHTGGEDHIPVHHTNEIAQSEAATGKSPFSRFWLHYAFLTVDGVKMSKSLGNYFTLEDIVNKKYDPLSLRLLYLGAHYKKPMNFTWEALESAQIALKKLHEQVQGLKVQADRLVLSAEKESKIVDFQTRFMSFINDDLNTPKALALVWEVLKSNIPSLDKYDLLISFDEVLGLGLNNTKKHDHKIPEEIQVLLKKRDELRKQKRFEEADKIRDKVIGMGFDVSDKLTVS